MSTVTLLADALGLAEDERAALGRAASVGATRARARSSGEAPDGEGMEEASRWSSRGRDTAVSTVAPIGGWRGPFLGRNDELGVLRAAWTGRRRLVVVSGEAGIGKTRLVDRFARLAHDDDAVVVCGRWSSEGLGPFEGFIEPLAHAAATADLARLQGAGELVRLLPDLASRIPSLSAPTRADPGIERRLLFEAVAALLASLGPTLVVLDDVQWADSASLGLLKYLAACSGLGEVVIVATVRGGEVAPDAAGVLAELHRRSDITYLQLGRLGTEELQQLIRLVGGESVSDDWVVEVAEASEGNTLFAEELAEHWLAQTDAPQARDGGGVAGVPHRIRDTILGRVASLSPPVQAILRAASVLGRQFDPRLAGRLVGVDDDDLVAAIEAALLSGLVVERAQVDVEFSHALVHAAISEALSSVRRTDFHRRAALALEELGDIGDPSTVARIARHWAEVAASDRSATAAAARWTVRAGDAALSVAATEEAIAHFERARQWWAGATVEHIETLIKLATALFSSGRTEEADQHYQAALVLARGLGQVTLQARAAIGLGRTLVLGQVDPERVAALEEVVDRLDPSESAMRVMVHAMLSRSLLFDRSLAATTRRNEIAGEVLAALDRPDVPTELLIDLGSVRDFLPITDPGPLDRLTKQIVAVAEQRRELLALANGWWGQAWSALERADPVAWAGAVAGHRRAAAQLGSPGELSVSVSLQCVTAQVEGRVDDAVVLADLTLEHGRAANDPNADALRMARSALFALDAGQAAESLPVMIELSRDFANVASFQAGLTLTAAIAGDEELAQQLLDDQGTRDFRDVRLDIEWLGVIAFLAHASVLVGDRAHCIALHDLLVKSPATAVRLGSLLGWWGPVDHHLGAMCRVLGRFEEAKLHIERALAVEDAMGAAPFRARSQQELELLDALETGPPQAR